MFHVYGTGGCGGEGIVVILGAFASNDMFKSTIFTLRKSNVMEIQLL